MTAPPRPPIAAPARTDVPDSVAEMMQVAQFLTGTTMMPEHLRNDAAGIFAVMLIARALDIPMAMAFKHITAIDGKVGMDSLLMQALVLRAGFGLCVVESSTTSATVRADRPGIGPDARGWDTLSFTIKQAEAAGLLVIVDDGVRARAKASGAILPWEAYTEDMLGWRAVARACRRWFADVLVGMVHTPDEIGGEVGEDGAPVQGSNVVRVDVADAVPGYLLRIRHADTIEALRAVFDDIDAAGHLDTLTPNGLTLQQVTANRRFVLSLPGKVAEVRTPTRLQALFDEALSAGAERADIAALFDARHAEILSGAPAPAPVAEVAAEVAAEVEAAPAAEAAPADGFDALDQTTPVVAEVVADTEMTPRRRGVLNVASQDYGGQDGAAAAIAAAFGRPVDQVSTPDLQEWLVAARRAAAAAAAAAAPEAPARKAPARKAIRRTSKAGVR